MFICLFFCWYPKVVNGLEHKVGEATSETSLDKDLHSPNQGDVKLAKVLKKLKIWLVQDSGTKLLQN